MLARSLLVAAFVFAASSAPAPAPLQSAESERVSISSSGGQANAGSSTASISADGNVVAFATQSFNLVTGDDNGMDDVLVRDRRAGTTVRVSVSTGGDEGDLESLAPAVSDDGRMIAFQSDATNLVLGDTNGFADIFVHDRDSGVTTRVSVSTAGVQADLPCVLPAISGDGRVITYMSYANTLVPDDSTLRQDIFVHELDTGETTLVSVASDGGQGNDNSWTPVLSATGRYVAFRSEATNLVPGDWNGSHDIFFHDRRTGRTSRVSVASDGTQANSTSLGPWLSADGRYVSFHSFATNLWPADLGAESDVFVHDRLTGITDMVSVSPEGFSAEDHANNARLSADGRFVSFESIAGNLVPGDNNFSIDVFVHDRHTGHTLRAGMTPHGVPPNGPSILPALSADGFSVVFETTATNLTTDDTNDETDIYVVDLSSTDGD